MVKKLLILFFLIASIGGLIGYALFTDQDLEEHLLFDATLTEFAKTSRSLELHFIEKNSLPKFTNKITLSYQSSWFGSGQTTAEFTSQGQFVLVSYGSGDNDLAEKNLILEPYLEKAKVKWKCTGGSVMMRLRSKACRLGQGVSFAPDKS